MTLEPTPSVMPEDDARRLTERIRYTAIGVRDGFVKLQQYVSEAQQGQAHIALGYKSWTAYLADVLGEEPMRLPRDERREVVAWLAGEGMSSRAIAPIVGQHHATVARDIEATVANATVETPDVVTSLDGRDRPRRVATSSAPTAFVVGRGIDGVLDVSGWSEDDIAEVMDEDNAGVTCSSEPIPETLPPFDPRTGEVLDGGVIIADTPAPEPKAQRRRPLPDAFWTLTHDLEKKVDSLARLVADDRFPQNKEKVALRHRNDLLRTLDALQRVVASLD